MKRITLVITMIAAIFCFNTNELNAQSYESGTKALNLGVGVGGFYHGVGFGVSGSFEVGIWETGDFGVIGLGAMAGVRFSSGSETFFFSESTNYLEFGLAPRGTYHFTIIPVENLDVYAAIQLLFNFQNTTYKNSNRSSSSRLIVDPAAIAGVRYYFSDNFGVFGEVGYSLHYLTGGIVLKF